MCVWAHKTHTQCNPFIQCCVHIASQFVICHRPRHENVEQRAAKSACGFTRSATGALMVGTNGDNKSSGSTNGSSSGTLAHAHLIIRSVCLYVCLYVRECVFALRTRGLFFIAHCAQQNGKNVFKRVSERARRLYCGRSALVRAIRELV